MSSHLSVSLFSFSQPLPQPLDLLVHLPDNSLVPPFLLPLLAVLPNPPVVEPPAPLAPDRVPTLLNLLERASGIGAVPDSPVVEPTTAIFALDGFTR